MELLLELVIFLVGAGLGISVRRQASRHAVADAAASVHPDSSSAEAPAAADGEVRASIEDSLVVLRSALDALPAGVVVANRTGVITFKNVAAAAMTGVRHVDVLVEEAAELGGAMAGEAFADHLAGCDVEGREQRGCAMALVVVAPACRLAWPHG